MGQELSQAESILKTLMSGGKRRGFWRKWSDLLPPPSDREARGTGMTQEAHGTQPRLVGKRTIETNRRITGTGMGDMENKHI